MLSAGEKCVQFKKILIDVNHSLNQMQKSLLILLAFQCLFLNSHAQSKPSGVEISRMVEILPTSQVRKTTTKPPARHFVTALLYIDTELTRCLVADVENCFITIGCKTWPPQDLRETLRLQTP